jgi:hypothetical protein
MKKLALAAGLLLAVSCGAFAQAPENPPQATPEATQPKPPASPEATQPITPAPEASKPMPSETKGVELATVVPGDSFSVILSASPNTTSRMSMIHPITRSAKSVTFFWTKMVMSLL